MLYLTNVSLVSMCMRVLIACDVTKKYMQWLPKLPKQSIYKLVNNLYGKKQFFFLIKQILRLKMESIAI